MLANCSPAVATPDEAEDEQRDDQPEVAADGRAQQHAERRRARSCRSRTGAPGRRCPGLLEAVGWPVCGSWCHAALPSMTRSRTRCSSISVGGPSCTTRPSRTTRTRSARPEHLLDLAGDDHHGHAAFGQRPDRARRSRCARRRRRRGSARRAAAPGSRAAATGRARPSAGCRRTGCAPGAVTPGGPYVEGLGPARRGGALGRRGRGTRRAANRPRLETVMLR